MVERVKLEEEIKDKIHSTYEPRFNGKYVTVHITIFRITIIIFALIGFVIGWWLL